MFHLCDSNRLATTVSKCSYLVVSPEHPLLQYLVSSTQQEKVENSNFHLYVLLYYGANINELLKVLAYVETAARKSDLERTDLQKEKGGVFTGTYAVNPATNEAIPVWVADYVLARYL